MKKFAPAATAVIMAALLTASCMTAAFAATPTDTAIDTAQKGSVTLYKYDSSKVVRDENGNVITKEDGTALAGEPVKDAGFSFYQILTYDSTNGYQLTDLAKSAITAYNTQIDADDTLTAEEKIAMKKDLDKVIDSIVVKESATAGDDGYATYGTTTDLEELIAIFQAYINTNPITPEKTETTNDDGKLTANNLELGVYFVVETIVPGGFIATTNSFLVSVPSWNQEANSGAGKWDYTITAYPKDEPYSGTLDKSIVDEGGDKVDTDSLSIGDTVNFEVTGKVPNYGNSVQNASLKLTQDRTIITQEVYDVLPFVFTDTLSTGLTYNDTLEIKVDGKTESLKQDTNATANDTDSDGKIESITWSTDEDKVGDYYVDFTDNKLTVYVKWDSLDIYQGNEITFTYDAIVNADAVVTDGNENKATIYVANNPSTFDGDYSTIETTGSASATDISTVYTYQLDLTKKFDGQDVPAGVNASDVKFEIYKEVTTGESTTKEVYSFINTGDGQYTLWTGDTYVDGDKTYAVIDVIKADGTKPTELGTDYTDDSKYVLDTTVKAFANNTKADSELFTQIAVSSTGTLNVKGLENGTYYLNEVATAKGYSILSKPVAIVVSDVATATQTVDTYSPFVPYQGNYFDDAETYYTTNDGTDTVANLDDIKTQFKVVYTKNADNTYSPFVAYSVDDFADGTDYYANDGDTTPIPTDDLSAYVTDVSTITVVYTKTTKTITGKASSDVEATVVGGQVLKTVAESPEDASGAIPITVNNAKNQYDLPLTGGLGLWIFTIGGGVLMAAAIIVISVVRKKKSNK